MRRGLWGSAAVGLCSFSAGQQTRAPLAEAAAAVVAVAAAVVAVAVVVVAVVVVVVAAVAAAAANGADVVVVARAVFVGWGAAAAAAAAAVLVVAFLVVAVVVAAFAVVAKPRASSGALCQPAGRPSCWLAAGFLAAVLRTAAPSRLAALEWPCTALAARPRPWPRSEQRPADPESPRLQALAARLLACHRVRRGCACSAGHAAAALGASAAASAATAGAAARAVAPAAHLAGLAQTRVPSPAGGRAHSPPSPGRAARAQDGGEG